MFYRHQPGSVSRLVSHEPVFTALKVSLGAFNRVAGSIGNKSTIQALRREPLRRG